MTYYTYMHTRNDTGKVFYIGKGQKRRAWTLIRRNKHWTSIVKKHGFTVHILAEWPTEKEAYDHEEFLIACFRTLSDDITNICDNNRPPRISFPGKSNPACKPGVGAKISASKKGITTRSGYHLSVETKKKIGQGNKGKARTITQAVLDGRVKMRETFKNQAKVQCSHCSKQGRKGPMTQWHFDNCKQKAA